MRQSSHAYKVFVEPANAGTRDECGQFVGYLALGLLACHLQDTARAKVYIAQAQANISRLANEGFTVRSEGPNKMVRVVSESSGLTETILLPIVDDVLLLPSVDLKNVLPALRASGDRPSTIEFTDIAVTYHRVRLRTGRLSHAIADLANIDSPAAAGAIIQDILLHCLYPAVPSPGLLDMTDDYLMVTLNLARQSHYPLAGMALAKAERALRDYTEQARLPSHSKRVAQMTAQLAGLAKTIAASAS